VNNKINTILAGILNISLDAVTDALAMKDVEAWDSLKHMELIATIEETLSIQLTFDEIVTMQDVAAIKKVLRTKGVEC
jgi:acyl carrier protein